jgi:BlaI family penicillinase repressor
MDHPAPRWSRRERQIMDALYALGKATAAEVRSAIADAPSYSAVRALLAILERKGAVRHAEDGTRYVYEPVLPRDEARETALKHLLDTFFRGSPKEVVATLLDVSSERLDANQLDELERLIRRAREEGR